MACWEMLSFGFWSEIQIMPWIIQGVGGHACVLQRVFGEGGMSPAVWIHHFLGSAIERPKKISMNGMYFASH